MKTHRVRGPFQLTLAFCVWWFPLASTDAGTDEHTISSPDGGLQFKLDLRNGRACYQVDAREGNSAELVLGSSPLGITRSDADFTEGLTLESSGKATGIRERYELTGSKVRRVDRKANERVFRFKNGTGMRMDLSVRAFDDGVAFRYGFPGEGDMILHWSGDKTGFLLPEGRMWAQPYQKVDVWAPGYEAEYVNGRPIGETSSAIEGWALPLLAESKGRWTMITESGLEATAFGIHLQPEAPGGLYQTRLPKNPETYGVAPQAAAITLPWVSPWRVIITGKRIGDIVESTLVTDLVRPSEIQETSWIKAGAASWSWWSDGGSPGEYSKLLPFVDIAADLGWTYSLIDLGWHEMRGGNIKQPTEYAATKNIGILVWYNSGGKHNQVPDAGPRNILNDPLLRDAEFARIAAMGIKVDFMQSDKQFVIGLYHDILRDAAKHKLVVNFHGAPLPRGWERTYPNLLTMEAVRGGEQYWEQAFADNAHTLNTIYAFTRNAVGPMDSPPPCSPNR